MYLYYLLVIFFAFQPSVYAQQKGPNKPKGTLNVDYPWVPRISAYKAYILFKAGKAIILHGGGMKFDRRHIIGAWNVINENDPNAGLNLRVRIPKLPRKGVLIITYCY